MKVLTVLGTRPEILRTSLILPKLDANCDHVVVHTGQNYDHGLNGVFFEELSLRQPDEHLEAAGSFGEQAGVLFPGVEKVIDKHKPDRFFVLGDTNSGLGAVVAKRMGVPIYHMEAGNRCYDDRVPEEVNRRLIDSCSDVLMTYSNRSKDNLLCEGVPRRKIHVVGNPILEVMERFKEKSEKSDALERHGLVPNGYFLATIHRSENVDDPDRLASILEGLKSVVTEFKLPVLLPLHPHTKARISDFGLISKGIAIVNPVGFLEFVKLERNAACILTDSGVISEEAAILGVPNVIVRDSTERGEVLESGSGIMSGTGSEMIKDCVCLALRMRSGWEPPAEYLKRNVSDTVVKIILGKYHATNCE